MNGRRQRHLAISNRRADQVNLAAFAGRGALPGCDAAFPELMESLGSMMDELT
jgi:hypothetical protein